MAAILDSKIKQNAILFIKDNFGKIPQREIARRLDIGKTTVNRWSSELGFHYIKPISNEKFFGRWNENSAYILGYIFADGNVAWNPKKSYWSLTITAAEQDKNHLEKMRILLSDTKPLLYSPKTKSYRLIAANKKLCQNLMKHGVFPRKSLTVTFPKIPKKYLRHFIRGVIDGDGSVRYVNRERSPYFEINIYSGSRKFLEGLSKAVRCETNIFSKVRIVHKNAYALRYTCTKGKKFGNWIYRYTHIFLERKFKQYLIMKYMEGN